MHTHVANPAPDQKILVTELSHHLRDDPDTQVPSHRKVVQLAADGELSPPLEKHNGRWVCRESLVPELKQRLRRLGLLPQITASSGPRPPHKSRPEPVPSIIA